MQVNPFMQHVLTHFGALLLQKWATVPLSLKEMLFSNKILFLIVFEVVVFKFEIIYKKFKCFHQKMFNRGGQKYVFLAFISKV